MRPKKPAKASHSVHGLTVTHAFTRGQGAPSLIACVVSA